MIYRFPHTPNGFKFISLQVGVHFEATERYGYPVQKDLRKVPGILETSMKHRILVLHSATAETKAFNLKPQIPKTHNSPQKPPQKVCNPPTAEASLCPNLEKHALAVKDTHFPRSKTTKCSHDLQVSKSTPNELKCSNRKHFANNWQAK